MPDVPAKPYDQKTDDPVQNLRYVIAKLRTEQLFILANMVELATSELVEEITALKTQIGQLTDELHA